MQAEVWELLVFANGVGLNMVRTTWSNWNHLENFKNKYSCLVPTSADSNLIGLNSGLITDVAKPLQVILIFRQARVPPSVITSTYSLTRGNFQKGKGGDRVARKTKQNRSLCERQIK